MVWGRISAWFSTTVAGLGPASKPPLDLRDQKTHQWGSSQPSEWTRSSSGSVDHNLKAARVEVVVIGGDQTAVETEHRNVLVRVLGAVC